MLLRGEKGSKIHLCAILPCKRCVPYIVLTASAHYTEGDHGAEQQDGGLSYMVVSLTGFHFLF